MANQLKIELRDTDNNQLGILEVKTATDFPLVLNEKISDIRNPTARGGSYSLTFKIPATATNNKTLKHLYDINILDASSVFSKKPITIVINGLEYKNYNYLKIKSSTHVNGVPFEYDCTIFGENMAWVRLLEELYLCDIDWVFNGATLFQYSKTNCESSWSKFRIKATADDYDYVFCPINYGAWENKEYVTVNDLRPQMRVLNIIKKGLAAIGYSLDSSFLTGDEFYTKIMTFSGDDLWKIPEAKATGKNFEIQAAPTTPNEWRLTATSTNLFYLIQTIDIIPNSSGNIGRTTYRTRALFNNEISDVNDNWDNTRFETRPAHIGLVNFKINLDELCVVSPRTFQRITGVTAGRIVDMKAYNVLVFIKVFKFNIVDVLTTELASWDLGFLSIVDCSSVGVGGSCTIAEDCAGVDLGDNPILETGLININSSEYVYVDVFWQFDVPLSDIALGVELHAGNITFTNLRLVAEHDRKIVEGEVFEVKDKLSCTTSVMDVIRGLKAPFNLYFRTDVITKTVSIEPRDEFYFDNDQALELTLDTKKDYVVDSLSELARHWFWRWRDDAADALLEQHKADNDGDHLGQHYQRLDDKFDDKKTEIIASSFFGTAKSIEDTPISESADTPVYIAAMWKKLGGEAEYTNDFVPRFLNYRFDRQFVNRKSDGVLTPSRMGWYADNNYLLFFPQAFAVPFYDMAAVQPQGNDPMNLFFHQIDITGYEQGLWDRFWNKATNIIKQARVLSGFFILKDTDMMNVDLRKPVFISKPPEVTGYYLIDAIQNYKPTSSESTKVILVKRIELTNLAVGDSITSEKTIPADTGGFTVAQGVNKKYLLG